MTALDGPVDLTAIPLPDPPLEEVRLADGRRMTWQSFGDPEGRPVLYFHGGGSTSLEAAVFHREAVAAGLRLLATNRPGAGGSTPTPGRPVAGYSRDLRELLDHLGVDRVACTGESNGGMVSLAVAATMADRVVGAVPVNPTVPWRDPVARTVTSAFAAWGYRLMRWAPGLLVRAALHPRAIASQRGAPPPGTEPDVVEVMARLRRDGDAARLRGELVLAAADWGFDPHSVPVRLDLFCGVLDAQAPFALVLADANPDAAFHHFPHGHIGFAHPDARRRICEVLAGYWG